MKSLYLHIGAIIILIVLSITLFVTDRQLNNLINYGANLPTPNITNFVPFPVKIYTVMLSGPGTSATELSIARDTEAERVKHDVRKGMVTFVMIHGHPYSIKYIRETKYFIVFKIENACSMFPFPECPRSEPIADTVSTMVQILGYKPL